jgi:hypothetical protein
MLKELFSNFFLMIFHLFWLPFVTCGFVQSAPQLFFNSSSTTKKIARSKICSLKHPRFILCANELKGKRIGIVNQVRGRGRAAGGGGTVGR